MYTIGEAGWKDGAWVSDVPSYVLIFDANSMAHGIFVIFPAAYLVIKRPSGVPEQVASTCASRQTLDFFNKGTHRINL